jgi:hypothetical protein
MTLARTSYVNDALDGIDSDDPLRIVWWHRLTRYGLATAAQGDAPGRLHFRLTEQGCQYRRERAAER